MSATQSAKGKAKQFLSKLFDSDKQDTKPDPPPKPTNDSYQTQPAPDLAQSFSGLSVSSNPQQHPGFIGGFNPGYTNPPTTYSSNGISPLGPLPRPPPMPMPFAAQSDQQSLTMQFAMQSPYQNPGFLAASTPPPRPHSTSPPTTPSKPKRPRASSTPSSTSDLTQVQCSGVTKAGKRCTRQVKTGPVVIEIQITAIERFCFQHTKELLGPKGEWVKFDDWIPDYLQSETQVALRVEMEKAHSQSDVPGYIYTFEIRDPRAVKTIKLKVGRAVNLVKRIDQWGKQCGSKEQVLRGWYPGTVEPGDDGDPSLMRGRVKAGEKGNWCHRLERLIHIELADLLATGVYLDPAWPNPNPSPSSGVSTPKKGGLAATGNTKPCSDCGAVHKEIFEFQRMGKGGKSDGKEWESIVKPVVEKWGAFVDHFV
ncbi:hypothetical protein BD779DRAFT_1501481 [Infundibulicybe gibba]|nr:hypothetical protein BD779DRAFT_1501481 [Infundibulicybe gibba]